MPSVTYKNWVFTSQALPTDLIKRGLAVEDPSSPHGLRLVIEDYPYAVDGLEIWDAIKTWVQDYVSWYCATDVAIQTDYELQAWWKEVVEKDHSDLKDKPWWPKLKTDPGVPVVYARFGALMLTTCVSYLSHSQVWALQYGTTVVSGRGSGCLYWFIVEVTGSDTHHSEADKLHPFGLLVSELGGGSHLRNAQSYNSSLSLGDQGRFLDPLTDRDAPFADQSSVGGMVNQPSFREIWPDEVQMLGIVVAKTVYPWQKTAFGMSCIFVFDPGIVIFQPRGRGCFEGQWNVTILVIQYTVL